MSSKRPRRRYGGYEEAKELRRRKVLTSSCCPAFRQIHRNLPRTQRQDLEQPLADGAIARIPQETRARLPSRLRRTLHRQEDGDVPREVKPYVDCVITFEELQALFDAEEIDLASSRRAPLDNASFYGRIFARSGGSPKRSKKP
jgi:iron only hydrogenase large subunit-like protein